MKADELLTKIILDTFTEADLRAYSNSRSSIRALLLENRQMLSEFNVPVSYDGYYFGDGADKYDGKYLIMGKPHNKGDQYDFLVMDENDE